jgi:hypothetical protein
VTAPRHPRGARPHRYARPVSSPAVGAPFVRTISAEEHLSFIRSTTAREGGAASFLQTPAWAAVKPESKAESIGWVQGD